MFTSERAQSVRRVLTQIYIVVLITVPSLSYGLTLGWVSLASGEASGDSKMAVLAAVTTFVASALSVPISAKLIAYGRKFALMGTSVCFMTCWALKLVSLRAGAGWMLLGRLMAGLSSDAAWTLTPLLAQEMFGEGWRGAAVSTLPLGHNAGLVLMYLAADAHMPQSTVLWCCLGISAVHLLLFSLMPESPSFLAAQGKEEEARAALATLRVRDVHAPELRDELKALPCAERDDHSSLALVKDMLRDKRRRVAFTIGLLAVAGQESCGVLAILQYAERLFVMARDESALLGDAPMVASPARHALLLGVIQLAGSVLSLYIVERLGRRPLILGCAWAVALSLGIAAWVVWLGHPEISALGVALAVAVDAAGLQAAPYALLAEMFDYKYRGCAMVLASAATSVGNAIEAGLFPLLASIGGVAAALGGASLLTLVYAMFATLCVPETRGRTTEQVYDALCPPRNKPHADDTETASTRF